MDKLAFTIFVILHLSGTQTFIIPDELPSLLSVIYSNIPTIKKGTDSRVGWGFRFGNRADIQVLTEIGPQTNTQPLANQNPPSTSNKRHTPNNLQSVLFAKLQDHKKQLSNTEGGKWLDNWRENLIKDSYGEEPRPSSSGVGVGEIDAKSVIPNDAVLQLEELYYKDQKRTTVTTPRPKTTTSSKDALDNVDLD